MEVADDHANMAPWKKFDEVISPLTIGDDIGTSESDVSGPPERLEDD